MDEALRQERSDPRKRTTWKERTHDASKSHRHVAAVGGIALWSYEATAQVSERTLRWAQQNSLEHPQGQGSRSSPTSWSRRAAARSRCGSFRAASSAAIFRTCPRSRAERSISWFSTPGLVGIVKDFAVLDLPFLFNTPEEADRSLTERSARSSSTSCRRKASSASDISSSDFGTSRTAGAHRETGGLPGLEVRVLQSPLFIELVNTLGANAVPMPFPEVYTGLEQKVIDGQENPSR